MGKAPLQPICLQDAHAVATEDLWIPHQLGRSVRHFVLPRPLLKAYRLWNEKHKRYVSLELHYLRTDCFDCEREDAAKFQEAFAKLAIFAKCSKEQNGSQIFQCADIAPIDAEESYYLNVLEQWTYLRRIPSEWKRRHMLGISSLLKV